MMGYIAAVLFFFARGLRSNPRAAVFVLLGTGVLSSAVFARADSEVVRCVAAFLLVIFLLHMWDLHVDPDRATRLHLADYLVFLPDYAWSVARMPDGYDIDLSLKRRAADAARYVGGLCLVTAVTVGIFRIDWAAYPFLLEHAAKSTCLAAWIVWAFNTNTALWRLAGTPAALFIGRNPVWASSPADFWRLWNQPMYQWLLENIYKPLGGRENPRIAMFAVFLVSGLLHEYLFAMTFRRVTGYPTAFFLLHGLAAMLTHRIKISGWLVLPATFTTFAFNTVSTILLFIPVDGRISFYVNTIPRWITP